MTNIRNICGFLVLLFGFWIPTFAQLRECASLYKDFKDNQTTNPTLAYESAKEFLKRCPNRDPNVKKFIDAFEKSAYEPEAQPTASPVPARTDPAEDQVGTTTALEGRYYALVIGNDSYEKLPHLKTAVADARAIAAILREHYGFDAKLLLNASRRDIFLALNNYRQTSDTNDKLLIYYAGHGHFDRDAERAYWLPIDARREDSANWISADDITSNIRAVQARHILLVSDSCYSGTIQRGLVLSTTETSDRSRFLQKMLAGKSRTLMASGGDEPVSDGGGDGHSVFGRVFLTGLSQMAPSSFTASELFRDFIQERVAGRANQTPEYNPLRNSGHESGDFVFVRKSASKSESRP